ncbi:hypothetical protein [Runella aurantiaca]|uniref:Uncharacterized protein n=1 Tax=Runella aurantiaca TaxID=2282308 RepID=A0A369IHG7_9BACT|nr:hypothetical protein [Runella aurantiaca]RDB07787.1 hypothetical protein DVG78_01660 [Runella aurantiaca]
MQELENAEWSEQVARLMELIRLDIEAVKRHTEANSPAMIVEQYQELRDEHLEELRTLLAGSGMNIELVRLQNVA